MASPPPQSSPKSPSSPTLDVKSPSRRSSFGFLHRSKSKEPVKDRKVSGNKITKNRHESAKDAELRRLQEAQMAAVPKLPDFVPSPQIQSFGGEGAKGMAPHATGVPRIVSKNIPVPPTPSKAQSPDPYARTESMTHRGRYSYAPSAVSTVDSPRRVRRRKDPTPYNILVVGARNSGKTSFLEFLRTSLATKSRLTKSAEPSEPSFFSKMNRNFEHHYLESDMDGERVGLTLWDSQGLEKNVVDLQLRDVSNFIQSKFEETFSEEMKVVRSPGVQDTHIHCVFLILDPVRLDANIQASQQNAALEKGPRKYGTTTRIVGALDEDFDLQVFRTLQGKTSVVPVISKADTITTAHMSFLKKMVHESLKKSGLNPLEALSFVDDDSDGESSAIVTKFDEREEDAEIEKNNSDSFASANGGSLHSSDSDLVHRDGKTEKPGPDDLHTYSVHLPYSILSPDSYSLQPGQGPIGRRFPWGFADPYNPDHCDFLKLKESCFREWRADMREASMEIWYERWRTTRLNRQRTTANGTAGNRTANNGLLKPGRR